MSSPRLSELLWVAYRRRWWLILPALIGLAGGYTASRLLPPAYRASTLIMAEQQRPSNEYVKNTVTTTLQDRLKSIEQQIVNRENLVELITTLDLYPEIRRQASLEAAVERARRDITIQMLGQNTFRIHYRGGQPALVARAANTLADQIIRDTLEARERQARTTSSFLETELDDMRRRLEEQENRIALFKQAHMGQLPEQREAILRSLEQLQTSLRINFDAMDKAELRKLILQREAAQAPPAAVAPAPVPIAERVQKLREELADLRSRYTELHPDVVRAQEALRRLEAEAAAAPPPPRPAATVDPVVKAEVAAVDQQMAMLQIERRRILGDIGTLQARLENIPRLEQELQSLTRDYDNIQSSYQSLLGKRIDARLAENLEKRRQDEQFTVLEKAVAPSAPYSPNLLLLLTGGLLVGAFAGVGLVVLREQTDQTYSDAEMLRKDFPAVPLLATVPLLGTDVKLGRGYYPDYYPERSVR